jgi:3-hydroxybutyryl-CoA dehydratase
MILQIGDKYLKKTVIEEEMILNFAKASGDYNDIHFNEEFAKTTIFKKRIAHGMLISGIISAVLGNEFPGQGTIFLGQTLKFLKPVFINDALDFEFEILNRDEKNWLTISTNVYKDGNLVLEGKATVTLIQKII